MIADVYMHRCIELAKLGLGHTRTNPLVGCVIVHNHQIIGEGWHQEFGKAHAEVNAIGQVANKALLAESTLYVNLEPCAHYGKTPPCANLIVESGIKQVVIGMQDPFLLVSGAGISKLMDAGIDVKVGILQQECEALNKRFITYHVKKRPYVILKWAQTSDGFIAPHRSSLADEVYEQKRHITGRIVQKLVHKWRSQESAIMVATNTLLADNPALNSRAWPLGLNPLRVSIDRTGRIHPHGLTFFDGSQHSLMFTYNNGVVYPNCEVAYLDDASNEWNQILNTLYKREVSSLIVEGGASFIQSILALGLWDEAQVFTTPIKLASGVKAPDIAGVPISSALVDNAILHLYQNVS
jgi:diaminohydroxyphosphoribosylaminopyrimidine deaminase/5-amino-6-(5-phosphoribosylamino)uracil reductase